MRKDEGSRTRGRGDDAAATRWKVTVRGRMNRRAEKGGAGGRKRNKEQREIGGKKGKKHEREGNETEEKSKQAACT